MSTWHYTREGRAQTPVSPDDLKQLAASGQLKPQDMVWKEGMKEWTPASRLKELFADGATTAVAVLEPGAVPLDAAASPPPASGGQIGYFSASADTPPHAVLAFKGYAVPTGPREWPLDDRHMDQLRAAVKLRKPIRNAANTYKALFALLVILIVIVGIALAFGGRMPRSAFYFGSIPLMMFTALSVLYAFCWRATWRNRRWAPLTMFILFMLSVAVNVISALLSPNPASGMIAAILGSIIPAALAAGAWRAYASIPKYLATPTWCQEVLIEAKQ